MYVSTCVCGGFLFIKAGKEISVEFERCVLLAKAVWAMLDQRRFAFYSL